ncbi:MAG: hypothetical protein AABY64_01490 [Bdellovibrionota bacterium]
MKKLVFILMAISFSVNSLAAESCSTGDSTAENIKLGKSERKISKSNMGLPYLAVSVNKNMGEVSIVESVNETATRICNKLARETKELYKTYKFLSVSFYSLREVKVGEKLTAAPVKVVYDDYDHRYFSSELPHLVVQLATEDANVNMPQILRKDLKHFAFDYIVCNFEITDYTPSKQFSTIP